MGSKLSLFRRTADNDEKQLSEGLNNLKVSEPAQPSEPTPISEDNKSGNVEPKCQCVDCKCDPCNCVSKDIPVPQSTDEIKEQDLTTVAPNETSPPNDEQTPQTPEVKEVIPNEESQPEESPKEEEKAEETPREETEVPKEEESPKEETHQMKCLCDPCECNPCKCCSQEKESPVRPIEVNVETQEIQSTEQTPQQSEQNESPVEEQTQHENDAQNPEEKRAEEMVKEIVEQIEETPQESNQALEVQTN